MTAYPWEPGTATGIGSLPGTDIAEAVKTVFGELPGLPHLPELPSRGPGADIIGRTAGLLVEMPTELYAGQWRVASREGRDLRRTREFWDRDLDAMTEYASDFDGLVKVQVAGPWTLAASLDLPIGGRILRDHGAVRDLVGSLAEGVRAHVADVSARLPRARVLLQVDEPSLNPVLDGLVPTESGYQTLRSVERSVVRDGLRTVIDASGVPVVVHSCAPDVPIALIREAGATAIALDLSLVSDLDALGEALDGGMGLLAGVLPTRSAPRKDTAEKAADEIRTLWRKIGFSPNGLAAQVVVTPACGLAGVRGEAGARAMMVASRDAATRLADTY